MQKFLGLILLSGYHSLPSENDYWSTSDDMEAPIFAKTMSRYRFKTIKRYLHVADNSNLVQSKVAKVAPLSDMLRRNCQQFGVFHEVLSTDEYMIPYQGPHSAKQFIKNKPVRFGYKMWAMCGSDGFPYNFSIHCGKEGNNVALPLGYRVVNEMLQIVENNSQHVIFFDNFFTSYKLINDLAQRKIRACGTIRENRTGGCPLLTNKDMKKNERGSYDYRSDGTVLCVKWNDNSVVTVASNYYVVNPVQKAERRVKKERKKVVTQPFVISMYNKELVGWICLTDCCHLTDQNCVLKNGGGTFFQIL